MITEQNDLIRRTRAALDLSSNGTVKLGAIIAGGSLRSFYRVEVSGRESCVLMAYTPDHIENTYFVDIGRFLAGIGIGVPRILAADPEHHLVWMEDLGGRDLYSLRSRAWEEREPAYRAALEAIGRLHQEGLPALRNRQLRLMAGFGPELYDWEHDYFFNQFVYRICHLPDLRPTDALLRSELEELTARLCQAPPALVHRDFQSQNVILNGERACLIDFQGLRHGTPYYDLGSLLYDPYVPFATDEREGLLDYYLHRIMGFTSPDAKSLFYDASSQRLMQALGAYGFLGQKQGKQHFLRYIPTALDNLADAAIRSGRLDSLHDLVCRCREVLAQQKAAGARNGGASVF